MSILVTCNCGRTLRARDEQAGQRCRCPACGTTMIVPGEAPLAEPIPAEPVQLGYAGTMTPEKAEPLIHGGQAPIPVIARPTEDIAKLDRTWRANVWWLLILAMIPLAVVTFRPPMEIEERMELTAKKHPDMTGINPDTATFDDVEAMCESLPQRKLDGALLPRHSVFPLLFALAATAVYVLLTTFAIPAPSARMGRTILTGIFTGTLGVMLLLGIQSFNLFCCIQAFYYAALAPDSPFGASLLGFVLGVGICEEIIKCLPVLFLLWRGNLLNWRQACIIGMASGAGFGISEGLFYSFRFYNGLEAGDAYLVRFISCVAFHTLLSGACALMIYRKQEHLLEGMDPINWTMTLAAIILVPIVLHGLFNTLSKKEMDGAALAVAIGSFIWVAILIRAARKREESVALGVAEGPRFARTDKGTRWLGGPPATPGRPGTR
jgi:RsiW-degrading membrane proteinase PrsW (M82 family)